MSDCSIARAEYIAHYIRVREYIYPVNEGEGLLHQGEEGIKAELGKKHACDLLVKSLRPNRCCHAGKRHALSARVP